MNYKGENNRANQKNSNNNEYWACRNMTKPKGYEGKLSCLSICNQLRKILILV